MPTLPTLYSNYRECMLDIQIYGQIISTPQQSLDELRESLFEEFKRKKPLPDLEYKRYELSRLVSRDYQIEYNRELELQDNETLVELKDGISNTRTIDDDFEDLVPLAENLKGLFSYENSVNSDIRDEIIAKYNLETGEEFKPGIQQTENIVGSISEDEETYLTDDEVDSLGTNEEIDLAEELPEDETTYEEDVGDDNTESTTYEFDDGIDIDDSEDSDFEDFQDEDTDSDEDDFEDFDTDSEDNDFDDFDTESNDEDDFDDFNTESEEDEDDFDTESEDENDFDDFSVEPEEDSKESDISKPPEIKEEKQEFVDSAFDDNLDDVDIEFIPKQVREKEIKVPVTPIQVAKPVQKFNQESVDRSSEPTDIREFLRKYPRCDYNFALKYFTKKQINDAIKRGKIIKRGNTLRV